MEREREKTQHQESFYFHYTSTTTTAAAADDERHRQLQIIWYFKFSHILTHNHLLSSERCCQSCSAYCFEILDSTPTKFQLKLKEAVHINWEKPNLNQQVHHVNLTLTL